MPSSTYCAIGWMPPSKLGPSPYRAPLDVRRVGGGDSGDRTPLMLGDQARREQLETVEEAEDLIPAPWPDPLAGPLVHRHRPGQGRLVGEEVAADVRERQVASGRDGVTQARHHPGRVVGVGQEMQD